MSLWKCSPIVFLSFLWLLIFLLHDRRRQSRVSCRNLGGKLSSAKNRAVALKQFESSIAILCGDSRDNHIVYSLV